MRRKILVVYSLVEFPTMATLLESIRCFAKYSQDEVYHWNAFYSSAPLFLRWVRFDAVLFHHSLTNFWHQHRFEALLERFKRIDFGAAVKAAFFQDEYHHTDQRCRFVNELGIAHVFSVAPPDEWKHIYRLVDFDRVKFHLVLTGYLDDKMIARVRELSAHVKRDLDIFFRTLWSRTHRIGRFGMLKGTLATLFEQKAAARGLKADVGCGGNPVLGEEWYVRLLSSRYTIGCESGASLLDRDGSINDRINTYVHAHPDADFDEVEKACFPGDDGNLKLRAIGPRHIEACLTRTCQVLVEGQYSGVLEAGKHYVELKSDLSNIEAVMDVIQNGNGRDEMVERAYQDVVASGRYAYSDFVKRVLDTVAPRASDLTPAWAAWLMPRYASFLDRINIFKAFAFKQILSPVYDWVVRRLSIQRVNRVLKFFGL